MKITKQNSNKTKVSTMAMFGIVFSLTISVCLFIWLLCLKMNQSYFDSFEQWGDGSKYWAWVVLVVMQPISFVTVIWFWVRNDLVSKWVAGVVSLVFSGMIGGILILFSPQPNWRKDLEIIKPGQN